MSAKPRAVRRGLPVVERHGPDSRVISRFSTKASTTSSGVIQECLMQKAAEKRSLWLLALVFSMVSCTGKTARLSERPSDSATRPQTFVTQIASFTPATLAVAVPPATTHNAPAKFALLVGINNYKYPD